jgi:hypothetical protein
VLCETLELRASSTDMLVAIVAQWMASRFGWSVNFGFGKLEYRTH